MITYSLEHFSVWSGLPSSAFPLSKRTCNASRDAIVLPEKQYLPLEDNYKTLEVTFFLLNLSRICEDENYVLHLKYFKASRLKSSRQSMRLSASFGQ